VSADRVEGLRRALELSPNNDALRLVLADTLAETGEPADALGHYEAIAAAEQLPADALVRVGRLALEQGSLQLSARCLEQAKSAGVVDGVADLQEGLSKRLGGSDPASPARVREEIAEAAPWLSPQDVVEEALRITFADVGGLDEVKKTIHRTIILPFQRPDLYMKYGRRVGGGVMLYGAPGCGKTMLARATAGECGLPFFNVRIEDVLDPMYGESERHLHEAFEFARANAPCVLFLDEMDAIAYARRKQGGSAGRALVDQLLQELDAIGSDNRDILVLAATNAPWDVDDALKRPGRLDRLIFVPPPDLDARRRILELLVRDRPTRDIDVKGLAKATPLFSGADLMALVERAVDEVIEEALDTGTEPPLEMRHVEPVRARTRPTTLDWLASARNYVEFANQAGRYDEVEKFLKSREARAWKE
jgi:SpoVK/Ycf46/Vps4 family AAA+-type ATPase